MISSTQGFDNEMNQQVLYSCVQYLLNNLQITPQELKDRGFRNLTSYDTSDIFAHLRVKYATRNLEYKWRVMANEHEEMEKCKKEVADAQQEYQDSLIELLGLSPSLQTGRIDEEQDSVVADLDHFKEASQIEAEAQSTETANVSKDILELEAELEAQSVETTNVMEDAPEPKVC